jgi:hypothetical protein
MTQAGRYILVVGEAESDRETAHALACRVLRDEHDWLDGLLGDAAGPDGPPTELLPWRGVREKERLLKWTDVQKEALRFEVRVKAHGHFGGEPGAPDALAARKALLVASKLDPRPAAIVLVRDLDDQPERARGFDQARQASAWPFAVVAALAEPMRECWVLAGFMPENDAERQALAEVRRQVGYDPCENAHDLNAKDKTAVHSPKWVLKALLKGDAEREARCLRDASLETLEARGERSRLKTYLGEVRERLAPVYLGG